MSESVGYRHKFNSSLRIGFYEVLDYLESKVRSSCLFPFHTGERHIRRIRKHEPDLLNPNETLA